MKLEQKIIGSIPLGSTSVNIFPLNFNNLNNSGGVNSPKSPHCYLKRIIETTPTLLEKSGFVVGAVKTLIPSIFSALLTMARYPMEFIKENDMVEIRGHAEKRICKRLGVPKKAVDKLVTTAFESGTKRRDISGSLRRYVDYLIKKENGAATDAIVYKGYVFLTAYDHLVTAWILPEKYKNKKASNQ